MSSVEDRQKMYTLYCPYTKKLNLDILRLNLNISQSGKRNVDRNWTRFAKFSTNPAMKDYARRSNFCINLVTYNSPFQRGIEGPSQALLFT